MKLDNYTYRLLFKYSNLGDHMLWEIANQYYKNKVNLSAIN